MTNPKEYKLQSQKKNRIMKIYKLVWYLYLEDQLKEKPITNKDVAEDSYREMKNLLNRGCWLYLKEYVEDEENVLREGEILHYADI